jgi:transcriptional regulator with XRE-family HTH domain
MKQEIPIEFGRRLKLLRKSLELTQKEFSEKIEVASSYISDIEGGKTKPGFEFLYKLGLNYNINPLYLLHGQEPMFLDKSETPGKTMELKYAGDNRQKIEELLYYLENSPIFMYAVLEFFSRYKLQNKELLDKDIEEHQSK